MVYSVDDQVTAIMFGTEFGDPQFQEAMTRELRERLIESEKSGCPLKVYAGYDPSKPDLHLGHSITMRKLREFQEFGHDVYFLVGTFTSQVGDASDKLKGRPRKTAEEVYESARTYADQCYRILDREKTKIVYNGEWLSNLNLEQFVDISSNFTVQQFLARDNFRKRFDSGDPIALHELSYALLQGYDAVYLQADVQIGATEQLFNMQAGRKLQQIYGQRPCVCLTYPILVGVDGKMRMSKSTGNYIGIAEPPEEQYGKTMSISDETMYQWIKYITRWSINQIDTLLAQVNSGDLHPMELKKKLAWEIVSIYHGNTDADTAQQHFETVHQQKELPKNISTVYVEKPTNIIDTLLELKIVSSRSGARRLIDGKGVCVNNSTLEDFDELLNDGDLLQIGKRRFFKIRICHNS